MKETYSEKLRDPRWQKRRLQILERDEWACQICYDTDTMLVVHHRYYLRGAEPWEYSGKALVTLCSKCHESEHECDGVFENLKQALTEAGAFTQEIHDLSVVFYESPPLDEVDFSVLKMELSRILQSKKDGTRSWSEALDRAMSVWGKGAAATLSNESQSRDESGQA